MLLCRSIIKIFKLAPVLLIFYCEFLSYATLPLFWPTPIECEAPRCIKILLVADPQILGEADSNLVARWDADNYLQSTFRHAIHHTRPDIIIFLGDLMDEGHIAEDEEFHRYLERFVKIFTLPSDMLSERIYISGDNDIGGEEDPILPKTVTRFNSFFELTSEPTIYLNLEFYKVNKMTQMFQEPDIFSNDCTRIAISHIPILRKIHTISKTLAKAVQPHLILSAHDHDSIHVAAPLDDPWLKTVTYLTKDSKGFKQIQLSDSIIHEIVVPTCSYRMGTPHMGYGLALIDNSSKTLRYTILWLPQRLQQLFIYIFLLIATGTVYFCWFMASSRHRIRNMVVTQPFNDKPPFRHIL